MTATFKAAIERAFDQLGGVEYLVQVGRDDPKTFCALLGKVLPKQLEHSGPEGEPLSFRAQSMTKVEVARRLVHVIREGGVGD